MSSWTRSEWDTKHRRRATCDLAGKANSSKRSVDKTRLNGTDNSDRVATARNERLESYHRALRALSSHVRNSALEQHSTWIEPPLKASTPVRIRLGAPIKTIRYLGAPLIFTLWYGNRTEITVGRRRTSRQSPPSRLAISIDFQLALPRSVHACSADRIPSAPRSSASPLIWRWTIDIFTPASAAALEKLPSRADRTKNCMAVR